MIPFCDFLERIRPAVNRRIEEVTGGEDAIDPGVLPLLIRGKRMRAGLLLCVHTCLARTTALTDRALDLACAVELAHAASLILDDMLDGDTVRRGAPSLHLTRGDGRAILDAVGILALPYALAAPYGAGYVTMLASAQQSMARGVAWEMLGGPDLPAAELYDAIVARKTGRLFSLAAAWGAMAAGEEETVVAAFANYGLSAGKAMQIADDIVDLHAHAARAQSRPGSEALLLRCVYGENGTRQTPGSILEREIDGATAWITDGGRQRVPPEMWESFRQVVRDIVGLTIAGGMPGDETGPLTACPNGPPQR
ncbi:polyprenyl synthetase family protein [Methanoculleus sp.]|jgi:geranylgeranyl pyrophosphate synthase|uniref:polyprenyl synthetase family protein n=1 Tax=Methanoculleus sp. TaxID=90427 RepID=UPI0025FC51B2|nr:polyprenyl synthetase family protein [Methanoculleus sp.]